MAVGAPPGPDPGPARLDDRFGHAGDPSRTRAIQRSGASISPSRGSVSRSLPQARQGRRPAALGDRAHELLALLVLLHLEVHAGQPEHRALEGGPLGAPLVEPGADLGDARHEIAADLVHDVVAEPLEQAHHRLDLAEERLLLGAHHRLDPVLPAGLAADRAAEAADRLAAEPAGVLAEQRQLALQAIGEVRAQPRVRLELEGVGRLVQGDPGPERADRHAQRAGRRADVLLDEQQLAGRRLGRQQREVVLAQDAGPHETEQEPELAGRHPAIGQRHRGLGESAAGRDDLVEQVGLELAHQRLRRSPCWRAPSPPGRRRRRARRRPATGCRARSSGPGRCGPSPRRRRVRRPAAQPGRGCPARHGSGRSRCVRPPASRRGRAARPSRHGARRSSPRHPSADPIRKPACQTRSSRHDGRSLLRLVIAPGPPARPVRRPGMPTRRGGRPGRGTCPRHRSSAGGGSALAAGSASRPLIPSSSASADAVAVAESTIATCSPTCVSMSARSSG